MAAKVAAQPAITVTELQEREKAKSKRPSNSTGRPVRKPLTKPVTKLPVTKLVTKPVPSKEADAKKYGGLGESKPGPKSSKVKEQLEVERKKKLEEKLTKEKLTKEKEKAEAMAEKRRAVEKKRQELSSKTTAKDKPGTKVPAVKSGGPPKANSKTATGSKLGVKSSTSKSKAVAETTDVGPKTGLSTSEGGVECAETTEKVEETTTDGDEGMPVDKVARTEGTSVMRNGSTPTTSCEPAKKPKALSATRNASKVTGTASSRPASSKTTTTQPKLKSSLASKSESSVQSSRLKTTATTVTSTRPAAGAKPKSSLASKSESSVSTSRSSDSAKPTTSKTARTTASAPATKTSRLDTAPASSGASPRTGAAGAKKTQLVSTRGASDGGASGVTRASKGTTSSLKEPASARGATGKAPPTAAGKAPPTASTLKSADSVKSPPRVSKPGLSVKTTATPSPKPASKSPMKTPGKTITPSKTPNKAGTGVSEKKPQAAKSTKLASKAHGLEKSKGTKPSSVVAHEKESVLVSEIDDVVQRNDVAQVPGALPSESSGLNGTPPLEPPDMDTSTAERVGQIISSQTSLSKELQSKLPRAGESISGSGNGAAATAGKATEADTAKGVELTTATAEGDAAEFNLAGQPSSESVGTSVDPESTFDLTTMVISTISTELQDLPEEFSLEWKEAREEEQRKEEEEREERHKKVDEIMERTHAEALQMDILEGKVTQPEDMKSPDLLTATSGTSVDMPSDPSLNVTSDPSVDTPESQSLTFYDPVTEPSLSKDSSPSSPTLPIIPDSSVDGCVVSQEPPIEPGTVSAQDSFVFSPTYELPTPDQISESATDAGDSEVNQYSEGVDSVEMPPLEAIPSDVPLTHEEPEQKGAEVPVVVVTVEQELEQVEPEELVTATMEQELGPVAALMEQEEPELKEPEELVTATMEQEPKQGKAEEPEQEPVAASMEPEEPVTEHEATPIIPEQDDISSKLPESEPEAPLTSEQDNELPPPAMQHDDIGGEVSDNEPEGAITMEQGGTKLLEGIREVPEPPHTAATLESSTEQEGTSSVDSLETPSEGSHNVADLQAAYGITDVEEKSIEQDLSVTFEDDEATSDVLTMLPEDMGKEMREILDDTAQRIQRLEEVGAETLDVAPIDITHHVDAQTEEVLPIEPPLSGGLGIGEPPAALLPQEVSHEVAESGSETPPSFEELDEPAENTDELAEGTDEAPYLPPSSEVPTTNLHSLEEPEEGIDEAPPLLPPPAVPTAVEIPTDDLFSFEKSAGEAPPPPPSSEVPRDDFEGPPLGIEETIPPPPSSEVPTADLFSFEEGTEALLPSFDSDVLGPTVSAGETLSLLPSSEVLTADLFSFDGPIGDSKEAPPPPPSSEVPEGPPLGIEETIPPPPSSEVPTADDLFSVEEGTEAAAPLLPSFDPPADVLVGAEETLPSSEVPTADLFSFDGPIKEVPPLPSSEIPIMDLVPGWGVVTDHETTGDQLPPARSTDASNDPTTPDIPREDEFLLSEEGLGQAGDGNESQEEGERL